MNQIIEEIKNITIASSEVEKIYHQIKALRDCYITLHNSIISRQSALESSNLQKVEKLTKYLEFQIEQIVKIEQGKIELILPKRFEILMGTLEFLAKKMHKIDERLEKIENDRHKEFTVSVKVEEKKEIDEVDDPLEIIMDFLEQPYRMIIYKRYVDSTKMTLKKLAIFLGLPQEKIRQKEKIALQILRKNECKSIAEKLPEGRLRTAIFGEA